MSGIKTSLSKAHLNASKLLTIGRTVNLGLFFGNLLLVRIVEIGSVIWVDGFVLPWFFFFSNVAQLYMND